MTFFREIENKEENFPSDPTFFYPPNLGGKWGGKSVNDVLYTNTCTLYKYLHFIHLTYPSLYSSHLFCYQHFFWPIRLFVQVDLPSCQIKLLMQVLIYKFCPVELLSLFVAHVIGILWLQNLLPS